MSTFTIGALPVATFQAHVNGSRQEIGDVQRLQVGILLNDGTQWLNFQNLVTTKYHVHAPLGGACILDIARGPGEGTLVIDGLGTTTAVLVQLDRGQYLPNNRSLGNAVFLITGADL